MKQQTPTSLSELLTEGIPAPTKTTVTPTEMKTPGSISTLTFSSSIEEDLPLVRNPKLTDLPYTEKNVPLYANLFQIVLKKNYIFYEYGVKFGIDNDLVPIALKKKVLSKLGAEFQTKYGTCLFTGETLFGTEKVNDAISYNIVYQKVKYTILVCPTKEIIEMKKDMNYMISQYQNKPEVKAIFEIIIKEILLHNPYLKYIMNLYGDKGQEKKLQASAYYNEIRIMPGFSTRVMILESGIYLNVDIKTKILSSLNCLQLIETFINSPPKVTNEEKRDINNFFAGRTIETLHTSQRFKVEMVNFDKSPKDYEIKVNGTSINLVKYFKAFFNIDVNPKSPLILLQSKRGNSTCSMYIPPELCVLVGLTEEMSNDSYLLKNIIKITKLRPEEKIRTIGDIMKLVNEREQITKIKNENGVSKKITLKSAYEKKEEFGIDLIDASKNSPFMGHLINTPQFLSKSSKIQSISRPFQVAEAKKIKYICFYHKENERDKMNFGNLAKTAAKGYGIVLDKTDYKSLYSEDPKDWIKAIESISGTRQYNIVVILIDEYLQGKGFYDILKQQCLELKGIPTQFVLTKSLGKNGMSIVSNILLQMNSKIGGVSYKVDFDQSIINRKIMVVGVDSSKMEIEGKRCQSVSFCATLNDNFTKFTNKKINASESEVTNTNLPIANFLVEALTEYFNQNKSFPKELIIYRQGVSQGEKQYVDREVRAIHKILSGASDIEAFEGLIIPYYYILVNKKTSMKFFEMEKNRGMSTYENPDSGLLITDKVVDSANFEFYIQPQKVTQGTATPTAFHVAYGSMNCPELIPKLTFDLCFLYSNWRGPVRLPAPLKYAEKLAKVKIGLNERLKNTLSYI